MIAPHTRQQTHGTAGGFSRDDAAPARWLAHGNAGVFWCSTYARARGWDRRRSCSCHRRPPLLPGAAPSTFRSRGLPLSPAA